MRRTAEGIVRLFKAVYGDGYPIKIFYDAEALTRANVTGEYYSIVARTASGEVVGVQHLYRSAPYKGLYETGAGLVLKKYRNLGVITRLMRFGCNEWVPKQKNIEEAFGEPVCNHTHMQRMVEGLAFCITALEVALMPAEAYDRERSASGRVATLLVFRCYRPRPHQVFLPKAYEQEMRFLYSEVDDARDLMVSDRDLSRNESSEGKMTVFDFPRVARIAIHRIGADFEVYLGDLEKRALDQKLIVVQVWIPLSVPWTGPAVDILRSKGYFFGGILPRWFDEDGMLMQKLLVGPNFEGIQLYSDHAKKIVDIIKEDWERTRPRKE